jgi:hypothetical protein
MDLDVNQRDFLTKEKLTVSDTLRVCRHGSGVQTLKIESNTLRQSSLPTKVNGISLTAHIGFPGVGTGFAASASIFFTTKSATYFSS